jgi:hypothetical protein
MTSPSRTLPPAAAAARIAPLLLALAGLAIAIACQWLWQHRRQIGAALVAAVATTYSTGTWCREQIEALAADSARLLPAQPVAALAPITATIAAAWGLVDRATMARAHRAQRARMADIVSAWIAELGDLPMVFAMEPIEPGEELLAPIRYRSSIAASAIEPVRFQAVVRVNGKRPNA